MFELEDIVEKIEVSYYGLVILAYLITFLNYFLIIDPYLKEFFIDSAFYLGFSMNLIRRDMILQLLVIQIGLIIIGGF